MSEKIFDNYDEAQSYSLTVPWKLETCNAGEDCRAGCEEITL